MKNPKIFSNSSGYLILGYKLHQVVLKGEPATSIIGIISDVTEGAILMTPYDDQKYVDLYGECILASDLLLPLEEVKMIFLLDEDPDRNSIHIREPLSFDYGPGYTLSPGTLTISGGGSGGWAIAGAGGSTTITATTTLQNENDEDEEENDNEKNKENDTEEEPPF